MLLSFAAAIACATFLLSAELSAQDQIQAPAQPQAVQAAPTQVSPGQTTPGQPQIGANRVQVQQQPATGVQPFVQPNPQGGQGGNGTTYVNQTGQAVNVMSTMVVPNPPPPSVIQILQPGQTYFRAFGLVGADVSFQLAGGGAVRQEQRQGAQGPYIALLTGGFGPTPQPGPGPMGTTYINRTGEVVDQYEEAPPSIPPTPSAYILSLQPNQTWTDGPTRVSPLQWRLRSGGQIRQVQEQTVNGQMTALVKVGSPTPGPGPGPGPGGNFTTYVNMTGMDVQVYSQMNGAPGSVGPPTFERIIPPNGSYQNQVMPGSPNKTFRLANGAPIRQQPSATNPNQIALVTNGLPTPGLPGNNPGMNPGMNPGGWQPVPGGGQWGPWQPVPGSGQSGPWQPVPGSGQWGEWQVVPGSEQWGPWQPVPGGGGGGFFPGG